VAAVTEPMNVVELRVDDPAGGAWNMAVDETLLERAAEQGVATLRLYQWSPAVLSLGYFQRADDRALHEPSRTCDMVRRSSGGGAIMHDRELTYSLSLPIAHPLAADAETLYRETHGLIVAAITEFGIVATLNERALVPLGGEPFLCFQRRAVGDVVVGEHKVCGSAQRRSKGAILQHGSVLVAASPFAPELPGLAELGRCAVDVASFAEALLSRWRTYLPSRGVVLREAEALSVAELGRCRAIQAEKYGADAWTNRR